MAVCCWLGAATPRILRSAVENGTMIRSSWSCPKDVCPLELRIPTTCNGTPLACTTAPIGFCRGAEELPTHGFSEDHNKPGAALILRRDLPPGGDLPIGHRWDNWG